VYIKNAMLEIINDMPACIGWKHGQPSKQEWLETREELEAFLGYRSVARKPHPLGRG
jgi:hypothetical protein